MFLDQVSSANIATHNIRGDERSLSFIVHIAYWPLNVEVRLNRSLNNATDVFPLLQIILHGETLLCPGVWPLATYAKTGKRASF
jgi:hypothetical protein